MAMAPPSCSIYNMRGDQSDALKVRKKQNPRNFHCVSHLRFNCGIKFCHCYLVETWPLRAAVAGT